MNLFKENLLLIGLILVTSTITTVFITGQHAYAIKVNLHHHIHQIQSDIAKASKHLSHTHLHSPNALGGSSAGSPGILSGNVVQVPVHVPVNVCGNTVNLIGTLNPAVGNTCANS